MEVIGAMPPYYHIAEHIWGKGVDIDSDGNSKMPLSTDWSELTLVLRKDTAQRIDIDPIEGKEKYLKLEAANEELANSVYLFLKQCGSVK